MISLERGRNVNLNLLSLVFVYLFLVCVFFSFLTDASRILDPGPGMEPMPPAVEVWSPRHWTTRKVPVSSL